MTLAEIRESVEAIRRGEYERWAIDGRVDRHTAIALLRSAALRVAWQPWARKEAHRLLDTLKEEVTL